MVPPPILDEKINIATWNIREFGKKKRKPASIHYIAEILSHFDLIAITEMRENTRDLEKVMDILGPYWNVIHSDVTMDRGGNRERIGYLYDKRVITFTGLAAEADPIRKKKSGEYLPTITWWRPPYMASFRAGKFDFVLLTVHIRWGNSIADRRKSLEELAVWVDKRRKSKHVKDKDIIVMGDFNIPKVNDSLYKAITSKGLVAPKEILGAHGTNLAKNKRYDQILYYPEQTQKIISGGVVDFYKKNIESLYPKHKYALTKHDYTYEMSDHLPIWIQLDVWNDDKEIKKHIEQN